MKSVTHHGDNLRKSGKDNCHKSFLSFLFVASIIKQTWHLAQSSRTTQQFPKFQASIVRGLVCRLFHVYWFANP